MISDAMLFRTIADRNSAPGHHLLRTPLAAAVLCTSFLSVLLATSVSTAHAQEVPVSGRIQTIVLPAADGSQVAPSAQAQVQIINRTPQISVPRRTIPPKIVATPKNYSAPKQAIAPAQPSAPTQPVIAVKPVPKQAVVAPPPVKAAPSLTKEVPVNASPKNVAASPAATPAKKIEPVNNQSTSRPISPALLKERLQLSAENEPKSEQYVDALIDPSIAEDPLSDSYAYAAAKQKDGVRRLSLELQARRSQASRNSDTLQDQAFSLDYSRETLNYGQFRFKMSAFRSNNRGGFGRNTNQDTTQGIGDLLIQQLRMPLVADLLADNTLGVQRPNQTYLNRVGSRNFLRYPLLRGLSSSVYNIKGDAVTAAYGKISRYRGGLANTSQLEDGNATLVSLTKRLTSSWSVGGEAWRTDDRVIDNENRQGYGVGTGYDSRTGNNRFAATLLGDEDKRRGYTVEASQIISRFRQNYGAYYFDEDFQWISEQIQNDTVGGYYNIDHNGGRLRTNASLNWSRTGLDRELSTSSFVGAGLNYRVNFRSALSASGSLRQSKRNLSRLSTSRDATIRTSLSLQHLNKTNSRFELSHYMNEQTDSGGDARRSEARYGYSWGNRQNQYGLELGVNYEKTDTVTLVRPQFGATLQRSWASGWFVSSGVQLSMSDANSGSRQAEWSAYITSEFKLSSAWALSLEGNYSQRKSSPSDTSVEEDFTSESNSVLLSLRYQHTSGTSLRSIGRPTGRFGSGDIRGIIYDDENNDNIRQPLEKGVADVEIYLDRKILAITDARGEFTFAGVSPGDHELQVSEQTIPLPFELNQANNLTVNVGLRDRRFVEISVKELLE